MCCRTTPALEFNQSLVSATRDFGQPSQEPLRGPLRALPQALPCPSFPCSCGLVISFTTFKQRISLAILRCFLCLSRPFTGALSWGVPQSAPASAFGVLFGDSHRRVPPRMHFLGIPRKHSESTRRSTLGGFPKKALL